MSKQGTGQQLPVKMYRTPDRITVAAPMPGLLPQDIEVQVREDSCLVLHGSARGALKEGVFTARAADVRQGHPTAKGGDAVEARWIGAPGDEWEEAREVLLDDWQAGGYHRELALPVGVDGPRATVTYGNGVLVVALPIAPATRPARLALAAAGPGRGQRVGSAGHPVQPLTTEEHRAARAAQNP